MSMSTLRDLIEDDADLAYVEGLGWTMRDIASYVDAVYGREMSREVACALGMREEDITGYANEAYGPDFPEQFDDQFSASLSRIANGVHLARMYRVPTAEALAAFHNMLRLTDRASSGVVSVFPEDKYDVEQTAQLFERIGWDEVVRAGILLHSFFHEMCRENIVMYLDAGVSGRFVCQVPVAHPGGEAYDVEEALFLEQNGVPPEYANAFSHIIGDESHTDNIVKMWKANVPLEYALAGL